MNEELAQFDAQLRELFIDMKIDEMKELLKVRPDAAVRELSDCNWNVIKKYYEQERYDLLLGHIKYVAYTSFMVEYAYQIGLISDDAFNVMMAVYNEIYERKMQG